MKTCAKHAEYFLDLAVRTEPWIYSANAGTRLDVLDQEHDNLRSALDWFSSQPSTIDGLRLATALAPFWWMRGYLTEGLEQLEAMLALAPETEESAKVRAEALGVASALAESRDDYQRAVHLGEESLRLFESIGGHPGHYLPYLSLGVVSYKIGDRETALLHWEAALDAATAAGATWHVGMALNNLGSHAIGELEFERAEQLLTRSLEVAREIGNLPLIAQPLVYLGETAALQGQVELAEQLLNESKTLFDNVGDRRFSGRVAGTLANVMLRMGRVDEAIAMCLQSVDQLWSTGERYHMCQSLGVYAQALAIRGEDSRAVQVLGVVDSLRESIHSPVPPEVLHAHNEAIALLRGRLSDECFTANFESGREAELSTMIHDILQTRSSEPS